MLFVPLAGLPFPAERTARPVLIIACLCYRVRWVPIAGFLLAGVVFGPGGGLVEGKRFGAAASLFRTDAPA